MYKKSKMAMTSEGERVVVVRESSPSLMTGVGVIIVLLIIGSIVAVNNKSQKTLVVSKKQQLNVQQQGDMPRQQANTKLEQHAVSVHQDAIQAQQSKGATGAPGVDSPMPAPAPEAR